VRLLAARASSTKVCVLCCTAGAPCMVGDTFILCRSGYGLHVVDPSKFPLALHVAANENAGDDSDSDDDALIQCSSQPMVCEGCKQTGDGPASSSLFRCSYCEVRRVHCSAPLLHVTSHYINYY
jgi:hypothetical protein